MGLIALKGVEGSNAALFVERLENCPQVFAKHGILATPSTKIENRARNLHDLSIHIGNRQKARQQRRTNEQTEVALLLGIIKRCVLKLFPQTLSGIQLAFRRLGNRSGTAFKHKTLQKKVDS
ncbi:hypothetical protein D3C80_1372120 [compost metagenome]